MKISIISLGCAKNKIDSELFLGLASKYGFDINANYTYLELVDPEDLESADVIVINTCGFIEPAKKESIDTIIDMLDYQKEDKIIVAMGCLVERYLDELKKEIPEVDYFLPIRSYNELFKFFQKLANSNEKYDFYHSERIISTPSKSAYIRIGEGCDNCCTYCAIPLIRGSYKSRPIDDIMSEIMYLKMQNINELTIIAQDTSKYGIDINSSLSELLDAIASKNYFKWIRVLYLYPDEITDELIQTFKKYDSIVKYFDIPIQHCNNRILKAMNRRGSKELIESLINKIRQEIPSATIRTTLIVGFPSETDKEFEELVDFVDEMKFDHLGAFTYSDEEGTKAHNMEGHLSEDIKNNRLDIIMKHQYLINQKRLDSLIGQTVLAMFDHIDLDLNCYCFRYAAQALDDVDGYIYVEMFDDAEIGEFYQIKITDHSDYDLYGKKDEEA